MASARNNKSSERFDNHLEFELKSGYTAKRETDDDGDTFFQIECISEGQSEALRDDVPYAVKVANMDAAAFDSSEVNLKGSFEAVVKCIIREDRMLIFDVTAVIAGVNVLHKGAAYSMAIVRAGRPEDREITIESVALHLSSVLNCMVIDNDKGVFEPITADMLIKLANEAASEAGPSYDGEFRIGKPKAGQHTHLDFLNKSKNVFGLLGGIAQVNQTGTEYAFVPLKREAEITEDAKIKEVLKRACAKDKGGFSAADEALKMSELFRVSIEAFDAGHDREQEIKSGFIQRAFNYNALRSFAWTLGAYCRDNETEPADAAIDTLLDIAYFVSHNGCLNYTENEICPVLCSGDDIHVYYLPDAVTKTDRTALLKAVNAGVPDDAPKCAVSSLDGLRSELSWMLPAVRTLHAELESIRDRNEPLEGAAADILYAWCSMAYAAREPIFSEDGPVNCSFSHPDEKPYWETYMEESALEHEREWLNKHSSLLDKRSKVVFAGKKFVFSGMEASKNWDEALKMLQKKGGLYRTAVSGQTDYLVCEPKYAGDSKIRDLNLQRLKGRCASTKVITAERFYKALGFETEKKEKKSASAEKKPAPADKKPATADKKPAQTEKPAKTPAKNAAAAVITYNDGNKAYGPNYEMDIPDGFVIEVGAEGRDFIAYRPSKGQKGMFGSDFVIFAGQLFDNDSIKNCATLPEYIALNKLGAEAIKRGSGGLGGALNSMFESVKTIPFEEKAFPGAVSIAYDGSVVHANVFACMTNGLRSMRIQLDGIKRKDRPAYDDVILEVFRHIRPKKSLNYLEYPDDDRFTSSKLTAALVKEWKALVESWQEHLLNARTIEINIEVQFLKLDSQSGKANIPEFKRNIKTILETTVGHLDELLKRCESVYLALSKSNPDSKLLDKVYDVLKMVAGETTLTVTIDKSNKIEASSAYAKKLKSRVGPPPAEKKKEMEKKRAEKERKEREAEKKRIAEENRRIEEARLAEARPGALAILISYCNARKEFLLEKQRLEEIERKEREAREAEKKRRREEREKKQKAEYEKAYAKWREECRVIEERRNAALKEATEKLRAELEAEAEEKRVNALRALDDEETKANEELARSESQLSQLGFFSFSKKRALRSIIEQLNGVTLPEIRKKRDEAKEEYTRDIAAIPTKVSRQTLSLNAKISKAHPLPEEPKKPAFMLCSQKNNPDAPELYNLLDFIL
ncbi:MAG: hypothetical protein IKD89_08705 [Clostridia bacterium]|nr:hypothetical protein [Clostridia bacterium]